jgi:hypothetical protein
MTQREKQEISEVSLYIPMLKILLYMTMYKALPEELETENTKDAIVMDAVRSR